MFIQLLKSKLHRARVTDANINYEGSLTISQDLVEAVGLMAYERILVSNMNNGNRFETYVIIGKPGAGEICLNGAAAKLGKTGDLLTIMSFASVPMEDVSHHEPRKITLREGNTLPAVP